MLTIFQKTLLSLFLGVLMLCLFALTSLAQTPVLTQTVRGTIVDKQIRTPLPGAVVSIK
jgi:CHASE3 domain sensor protein